MAGFIHRSSILSIIGFIDNWAEVPERSAKLLVDEFGATCGEKRTSSKHPRTRSTQAKGPQANDYCFRNEVMVYPVTVKNPVPEAWNEYRKRRNTVLMVVVGYMPVMFGIGLLSQQLFSTFAPAFAAAFAGMAFLVIAFNMLLRFPCPRCGKWFFATWWYHNNFARRCVHCGLPKYAAPDQ